MKVICLKTQLNDEVPITQASFLSDNPSEKEQAAGMNDIFSNFFDGWTYADFHSPDSPYFIGGWRPAYVIGYAINDGTSQDPLKPNNVAWMCLDRQKAKEIVARNWLVSAVKDGSNTVDSFIKKIQAIPDNVFNEEIKQYENHAIIPSLNKPKDHRENLTIHRFTQAELDELKAQNPLPGTEYDVMDGFDFLKSQLSNSLPNVEANGFELAKTTDDKIVFKSEAVIVAI